MDADDAKKRALEVVGKYADSVLDRTRRLFLLHAVGLELVWHSWYTRLIPLPSKDLSVIKAGSKMRI